MLIYILGVTRPAKLLKLHRSRNIKVKLHPNVGTLALKYQMHQYSLIQTAQMHPAKIFIW